MKFFALLKGEQENLSLSPPFPVKRQGKDIEPSSQCNSKINKFVNYPAAETRALFLKATNYPYTEFRE